MVTCFTCSCARQKACDLPIIRKRLSAKQIAVELVDGEDIVALLQHIAGDGEGDVV